MDQATTGQAKTATRQSGDHDRRTDDRPRSRPEPRSFTAPSFTEWDAIALRYLEEDPENG